jgi:monomeric isocitrate dehydrogenase
MNLKALKVCSQRKELKRKHAFSIAATMMKSLINYFCFIVEVFFAAVFEKYSTYLLN